MTDRVKSFECQVKTLETLPRLIQSERRLKRLGITIGRDDGEFAPIHRRIKKRGDKLKAELKAALRHDRLLHQVPPRISSEPHIVVISDSEEERSVKIRESVEIRLPARRERHKPVTDENHDLEHALRPSPRMHELSPSPSEYQDTDPDSEAHEVDDQSLRRHAKGAQEIGIEIGITPRGNQGRRKRLPTLSRKELKRLAAWKASNGTDRYAWPAAYRSVPSLKRMALDDCRRAFWSQRALAMRRGEHWVY